MQVGGRKGRKWVEVMEDGWTDRRKEGRKDRREDDAIGNDKKEKQRIHCKRWSSMFRFAFMGHCRLYFSSFQHFVNATDDLEDTVTFGNKQHRENIQRITWVLYSESLHISQGGEVGANVAEAVARSHDTTAVLSLGFSPNL